MPANQNPFQVLSSGIVKIGEYLQQRHTVQEQWWQAEEHEMRQDEEHVEFSDTFLQLTIFGGREENLH